MALTSFGGKSCCDSSGLYLDGEAGRARGYEPGQPMGEPLYILNHSERQLTANGRHPPQGSAISTEAYVF
ncbi:hypothetical protein MPL3356_390275 [Mesorhizobium plurifarium]|uniref:Uncharacterized protein n=1 Tax=Mesorhizobium plurifarium TaxID=69974 RepID=A0A090E5A6_MESPL|nr:hypothetical protein MPL3356_390275 [Mesorhizobium plurifarium]